MGETRPHLLSTDLLTNGFEHVCEWQLHEDKLQRSAQIPPRAGVYAFCINGVAQYVGVASRSLDQRLYLYGNPGSSQRTNLRVNALISAALREGSRVEVLIATPPDLDWNGWRLSGAEGLEAGLIKTFQLPWNVRGVVTQSIDSPPR